MMQERTFELTEMKRVVPQWQLHTVVCSLTNPMPGTVMGSCSVRRGLDILRQAAVMINEWPRN
jgi:hypothetical protein